MSNARQRLLEQVISIEKSSYAKQLAFLTDVKRVSSECRERFSDLLQEISLISELDPMPDVEESVFVELEDLATSLVESGDQTEFNANIDKLQSILNDIAPAFGEVDLFNTSDLLNKRMIDLMGVMKHKIRFTARRHNDAGGGYDKAAFISARNQAYFARHVYIDKLDQDLVKATNEDCAKIEQLLYPGIVNSTPDEFVGSIVALLDFINAQMADTQA